MDMATFLNNGKRKQES